MKEEQERREHEEYLKLKEAFVVEEEGEAGGDEEEGVSLEWTILPLLCNCQHFHFSL